MKTVKLLLLFAFISTNAFAQCYKNIASFDRNYIALQSDGTLWAKGTGFYGTLGFGNRDAVAEFTQIGTDNNWTENLSIGVSNVFAIKTDGTLWVWGSNSNTGSTGLGTYDDLGYFSPRQVGADTDWKTVNAGKNFTLALKTDGSLWVWGDNTKGQLGIGNPDDAFKTNLPIRIGTETNWSKLYTGVSNMGYAIKTDGTLWSWGNDGNFIGYTEAPQNNNYRTPHHVGTDTWEQIAVASFGPMTDGIKTDGSLWGWGKSWNQRYFFGNGVDVYSSQTPVRIGNDTDWKHVCLGQRATIVLKTNGTRWGWGGNSNGYELGMGVAGDVASPMQLDADNDWKLLNADLSDNYGDGIKQNNALYHWGNDHLNVLRINPALFSPTICTLRIGDFEKTFFTAYPNPVNDILHIRFDESIIGAAEISLFNSIGQELFFQEREIVDQECILSLKDYSAGVYFLTLRSNGRNYKTKLIKN